MNNNIAWQLSSFNELNTHTLYDILKLRTDVFVVEQNCPYAELDDLDRHEKTQHLYAYKNNQLIAYLRILQHSKTHLKIGRVVVAKKERKLGIGNHLLEKAITYCKQHPNALPIAISAQAHLYNFYAQHGFTQTTKPYLEDNIPHIGMQITHQKIGKYSNNNINKN